jgi:DNA-binding transcriptional regulator LsrR (DeoR family)
MILPPDLRRQNDDVYFSHGSCFTHEEIAQMIGTSRETVTRLFNDFKKQQILQLKGSTLLIRNKAALKALATGGQANLVGKLGR